MQVVSENLPFIALVASHADFSIKGSTYIEFDQVEVPVSNLLGVENKGFPVIMNSESEFGSPSARKLQTY
jgi:alkylation response protein AidB-like acyl-CoA dehydrogenase